MANGIQPYERVVNDYLRDDSGAALLAPNAPQWPAIWQYVSVDGSDVSNVELSQISADNFVAIQSDIRAASYTLSNEVASLGNLVIAAHEDTIQKLNVIQGDIQQVNHNIVTANNNVAALAKSLNAFRAEFQEYVEADAKATNVQRATTELGNLNQRLDSEFGQNKELRRTAVGVLQATDLAGIRSDTILTSTEELLIKTPNYWLGPALVVLARWVKASQDTDALDAHATQQSMSNMLNEAYKRDRAKTSLFFGLICLRAGYTDEANRWFEEYLSFQRPEAVDRTCISLLNICSTEMSRGKIDDSVVQTMVGWQADLLADPHSKATESLVNDWKGTLTQLVYNPSPLAYPALEEFSPTWGALSASLRAATVHEQLWKFLDEQLSLKDFEQDDKELVDSTILTLVSEFDGAELPVRREQEYQKLIIDLDGNVRLAQALRTIKDDVLSETKSMTSTIADAARDVDLSYSSAATHVFALKSQLPWVERAYHEFTEEYQAKTPTTIKLELGGYTRSLPRTGFDEASVIDGFLTYVDQVEAEQLAAAALPANTQIKQYVSYALMGVGAVLCLTPMIPLGILMLIGGVILFLRIRAEIKQSKERTEAIKKNMADMRANGTLVLRMVMQELKSWNAEYGRRESFGAKAEGTIEDSKIGAEAGDGAADADPMA